MEDAEIIVLRIFTSAREVIERNKGLKVPSLGGRNLILADIKAAGEHGSYAADAPGAAADSRQLHDAYAGGGYKGNCFL